MSNRTVLLKITDAFNVKQIVTARSLTGRLARPADYPDVVARLLHEGEAGIDLRDGGPATLTFADPEPVQAVLPLRRLIPPPLDYEATVDLRFQIPAHIQVRAGSKNEARQIIDRVLRNECHPPAGFLIRLADEDIDDFMSQFDNAGGDPHRLGVHSHLVTDIRERLLISRADIST
jgi:hypothetical protein